MTRKLFEISGEDEAFRPSPYCWRTRMALVHKGLDFEPIPWRAVEKERIIRSGGGTVPVLVDRKHWIRDSWDIAVYLDAAYPDSAALFSSEASRVKARFIDHWITNIVHPVIFRALVQDYLPLLSEKDRAGYEERTQAKFGKALDEISADPDSALQEIASLLAPLQKTLAESSYLGGTCPDYGDYIVFGAFQWARVASVRRLVPENSPADQWFFRLLHAFDGFAAAQPSRSHWG